MKISFVFLEIIETRRTNIKIDIIRIYYCSIKVIRCIIYILQILQIPDRFSLM